MKVLVFVRNFGRNTETFIYNTIESLSDEIDVEVKVVACTHENRTLFPFNDIVLIPQKNYGFIDKINWRLRRSNINYNLKDLEFSRKVNPIVESFKPDIIHCNFGNDGIYFFDNLKRVHKNNIPIFFHFHGYDASNLLKTSSAYRRKLKKLINRKSVSPILVSKHMLETVKQYGIRHDGLSILYYGVDLEKFKRTKYQMQSKTFLQISSFREKKGHEYTIEAFRLFLKRCDNPHEYKLILAGGGELLEDIKRSTDCDEFRENFIFPGWVSHADAVDLMNEADFFVHHSVTGRDGDKEGIPNSLIEAMAMEMPILSTFHSGIPELVEDKVNGFLVHEKDILTYSRRFEQILNWGYCPHNRVKVQQMFSRENHKSKLLEIFRASMEED